MPSERLRKLEVEANAAFDQVRLGFRLAYIEETYKLSLYKHRVKYLNINDFPLVPGTVL